MTRFVPTEIVYRVKRSVMSLNDSLMGLNFLFREEKPGFIIDHEATAETFMEDAGVQTMISYELSTVQINYYRQLDTILDLLSSLGGLFSALSLIFYCIVSLFHFYGSYQFIMEDLFTNEKSSMFVKSLRQKEKERKSEKLQKTSVRFDCMKVVMLNLQAFICPSACLKILKLSRRRRLIAKSYKHTLKEISITRIIK